VKKGTSFPPFKYYISQVGPDRSNQLDVKAVSETVSRCARLTAIPWEEYRRQSIEELLPWEIG